MLDKYLKSRLGRVLLLDEIENVEAVTNVLAFTIECSAEIEAAYCATFIRDLWVRVALVARPARRSA